MQVLSSDFRHELTRQKNAEQLLRQCGKNVINLYESVLPLFKHMLS